MANYVTPQEIRDRMPPERLKDLLSVNDGEFMDEDRLETACVDATRQINAYIGKITSLPLQVIPDEIKVFAFRIARYNLLTYTKAPILTITDEARDPWVLDYNEAIEFLEKVAMGALTIKGLGVTLTADMSPHIIAVHSSRCKFTERYFRRGGYDHH